MLFAAMINVGDPVDLMEGDAGEGTEIADGEYVTDDEYEEELSEDGKVMTRKFPGYSHRRPTIT